MKGSKVTDSKGQKIPWRFIVRHLGSCENLQKLPGIIHDCKDFAFQRLFLIFGFFQVVMFRKLKAANDGATACESLHFLNVDENR